MCIVFKIRSVKNTSSVFELQRYYMLMLLCLVFPVRFCVGVFCLVFDRISVHFCYFLFLCLHCFTDRLHYSQDVFPSLSCLWFVYLFPFLMLLRLFFTFINLWKCFQLQYHLKNLIYHYHPFDIVGR